MDEIATDENNSSSNIAHLFLLVTLCTYCAIKWLKYYKIPANFPPGPPSIPFIGCLPFMQGDFKSALQDWRHAYGDIVGIQMGSELAVVLSDYEVIATAFKDDRCTGRPKNLRKIMHAFFASHNSEKASTTISATVNGIKSLPDADSAPTFTSSGIVFAHGPDWAEQRRFSLRTLRDYGFGKSAMETVVVEEVDKFTEIMHKLAGETENGRILQKSGELNHKLSIAVVNSLWSILTGEKIQQGDKRVIDVVVGTGKFIRRESLIGAMMIYPWMRHLPILSRKFSETKESPLKMRRLQDDMVAMKQKRRESRIEQGTLDDNGNCDFIDEYLTKVASCRNRKSSFYGDKGVVNLQRSLTDLFGAGSETSTSMLLFSFLYMIKYPGIQAKVHDEIDRISGDRLIHLADRPLMPYTEATINEVLRHTCLVYTVPHCTTDDLELDGYALPKDTAVYANMWQVMRDPDYWEDPDSFRPERFLDDYGNYRSDERNIPFMMGKRVCIGQNVAMKSLFLFFAGILQRFQLVAPDGAENVSAEPIVGFIHYCPLYDVELIPRSVPLRRNSDSLEE